MRAKCVFQLRCPKGSNYLENRLDATCLKEGFEDKEKIFSLQEILAPDEFHALLGPSHVRSSTKLFKSVGDDGKIFPNYFANVIISRHHKRLITPMRYRIRPHGPEEEIPTKFNVFNARFDSLKVPELGVDFLSKYSDFSKNTTGDLTPVSVTFAKRHIYRR